MYRVGGVESVLRKHGSFNLPEKIFWSIKRPLLCKPRNVSTKGFSVKGYGKNTSFDKKYLVLCKPFNLNR